MRYSRLGLRPSFGLFPCLAMIGQERFQYRGGRLKERSFSCYGVFCYSLGLGTGLVVEWRLARTPHKHRKEKTQNPIYSVLFLVYFILRNNLTFTLDCTAQ